MAAPSIVTLEKNIEFKSMRRLCDNRQGSFLEKIIKSSAADDTNTQGRIEQIVRVSYDALAFGAVGTGGPTIYSFTHDETRSLYTAHGRRLRTAAEIAAQKANDSHLPIAHPTAMCALPDMRTVILLDGRHFTLWTFDATSEEASIVAGLAGNRAA